MSLSVSYSQNINSGVDAASLKEVTQQIFSRANSKSSALANYDLTKFNRPSLGADLYSGKVDAATARQIAVTNSGMDVKLSENAVNSLKYLSSEASKSIFANMDGKINPAAKEEATVEKKSFSLPSFGQLTETADLAQDKNGSNPFYRSFVSVKKDEEKDEVLNLVA